MNQLHKRRATGFGATLRWSAAAVALAGLVSGCKALQNSANDAASPDRSTPPFSSDPSPAAVLETRTFDVDANALIALLSLDSSGPASATSPGIEVLSGAQPLGEAAQGNDGASRISFERLLDGAYVRVAGGVSITLRGRRIDLERTRIRFLGGTDCLDPELAVSPRNPLDQSPRRDFNDHVTRLFEDRRASDNRIDPTREAVATRRILCANIRETFRRDNVEFLDLLVQKLSRELWDDRIDASERPSDSTGVLSARRTAVTVALSETLPLLAESAAFFCAPMHPSQTDAPLRYESAYRFSTVANAVKAGIADLNTMPGLAVLSAHANEHLTFRESSRRIEQSPEMRAAIDNLGGDFGRRARALTGPLATAAEIVREPWRSHLHGRWTRSLHAVLAANQRVLRALGALRLIYVGARSGWPDDESRPLDALIDLSTAHAAVRLAKIRMQEFADATEDLMMPFRDARALHSENDPLRSVFLEIVNRFPDAAILDAILNEIDRPGSSRPDSRMRSAEFAEHVAIVRSCAARGASPARRPFEGRFN